MRDVPTVDVEMTFLTKAQGGREQPPPLTTPTMYRPHLVVGDGEYLGVIFVSAPERVQAQSPFTATLGLVHHPNVDYSPLVSGAEFTVREGPRVVGRGRVLDTGGRGLTTRALQRAASPSPVQASRETGSGPCVPPPPPRPSLRPLA